MLTAGGECKPRPTQYMLNAGPASPVLASIHSALASTSCWRYQHAVGTVTNTGLMLACMIESTGQTDRNEWDRQTDRARQTHLASVHRGGDIMSISCSRINNRP